MLSGLQIPLEKRDMGTPALPFPAAQVEDRVGVRLLQELLPAQLTAPIFSRHVKGNPAASPTCYTAQRLVSLFQT